jgi:hypothetical protein
MGPVTMSAPRIAAHANRRKLNFAVLDLTYVNSYDIQPSVSTEVLFTLSPIGATFDLASFIFPVSEELECYK